MAYPSSGKDALLVGAQHNPAQQTATVLDYFPGFGYLMIKDSVDVGDQDDAVFTLTGTVYIPLIVGQVTSVLSTGTSLELVTSATTSIVIVADTAAGLSVGTLYGVSGDPAEIFNAGQVPIIDVLTWEDATTMTPLVLGREGTADGINQVNDQSSDTGYLTWSLFYVPLTGSGTMAVAS